MFNNPRAWTKTETAPQAQLDRDRLVTLSIGQLTDAIAEALKVVSDAGPRWRKGDRAYVEVEVTGGRGRYTSFVLVGSKHISLTLPTTALQEPA